MTGRANHKYKTSKRKQSLLIVNSSWFLNKIEHDTAKLGEKGRGKANPLLYLSSAQVNTDSRYLQQAFGKSNFIKITWFLAFWHP